MTTDENENKDKTAELVDNDEQVRHEKRSASRLAILMSLMFSIIAVGFAAYNYLTIDAIKSDSSLTEKIDQFETSRQALNHTITSMQSLQQDLERELTSLADSQERAGQSLQILFNNQNNDEIGWSVAEVEHLLNIANLRITLEQDIDTALAALQSADNRLALLGDPELFIVRRQLTAEMNALKSVEPVDITGLSLYLADMVRRVKLLPLKPAAISENSNGATSFGQSSPSWKKVLINVWYEFKGMFTIIRTGGNSSATLLPDEKYFLYQNLRLQLEAARLAVLRRDTASLRESLQVIRVWLIEYFDTNNNGVASIIQATESMSDLVLDPDLPIIGSSLDALHSYMTNRDADDSDPGGEIP